MEHGVSQLLTKSLQKYGYRDFYNGKKFNLEKYYSLETYKKGEGYSSDYNSLVGRYFYVKEILSHPKQKTSSTYSDKYYFKLEDKKMVK